MSEPTTLLLAGLAVLVAAFAQGVTGFGHALLAIGVLAHLLGTREAILVLSLLAPPIAIAVFARLRKSVEWRETLALAVPLCVLGMPLGVWLFGVVDEALLRRAVGVLLIAIAALFLTPWAPKEKPRPLWMGATMGFVSGFLNGLASTGGPPLVLYLWARDLTKDARMAILQAVFVCGSLSKIVVLLLQPSRPLTWRIAADSAVLCVPLVLGVLAGHAVYRRLPVEVLKKLALVMLAAMGVSLL